MTPSKKVPKLFCVASFSAKKVEKGEKGLNYAAFRSGDKSRVVKNL